MDGQGQQKVKVKELTNEEREQIVSSLLTSLRNGQLPRGEIKKTAESIHVSRKCVSQIWNRSVKARQNGNHSLSAVHNLKAGMRNNLKYDIQLLKQDLKKLKPDQRSTFRDCAENLKVSKTTVVRAMNEGAIVSHTSSLVPRLTEENKLNRFLFCCDEVRGNGIFKDMLDRVHVDEKWFYCDSVNKRFLLADGGKGIDAKQRTSY